MTIKKIIVGTILLGSMPLLGIEMSMQSPAQQVSYISQTDLDSRGKSSDAHCITKTKSKRSRIRKHSATNKSYFGEKVRHSVRRGARIGSTALKVVAITFGVCALAVGIAFIMALTGHGQLI